MSRYHASMLKDVCVDNELTVAVLILGSAFAIGLDVETVYT